MKSGRLLPVAAAAIATVVAVPAVAQPIITTNYSYYAVPGESLADMHRAMRTRGPMVNGTRGYGITLAGMGKQMSVASCKAKGRYQLSMNIIMKLPKAGNPSALTSGEMSEWNRFASFVRGHEETHRTIWRECAAEMERQFMNGETRDCATAHSRAMDLWRRMIASCKPRQTAFDKAQRNVLKSHPFMKYASR